MAIVYRIDNEIGITFVLWHGVVTADDFLAQVRRLTSDPDWPPSRGLHLADLRHASVDASIDEAAIETAANLYGMQGNKVVGIKAAIVAGQAFTQSVLFQRAIARFGPRVIVFDSLGVAAVWLGIDANAAERELQALHARDTDSDSDG
jgi:hypothetical protein